MKTKRVLSLALLAACQSAPPTAGQPPSARFVDGGAGQVTPPADAQSPLADAAEPLSDVVAGSGVDGSGTGGDLSADGAAKSDAAGSGPAGTDANGPAKPPAGGSFEVAKLALSGTRLKVQVVKSDDGAMMPGYGFYDAKLKTACAGLTAADNKLRCLPAWMGSIAVYGDAACTQALVMAVSGTAGEYATVAKPVTAATCGGGPQTYQVYAVTGLVAKDAPLYTKSGDSCTPVPEASKAVYQCYTLATLGATEVPPSQFAELHSATLD